VAKNTPECVLFLCSRSLKFVLGGLTIRDDRGSREGEYILASKWLVDGVADRPGKTTSQASQVETKRRSCSWSPRVVPGVGSALHLVARP
jgi:hypothetical protein